MPIKIMRLTGIINIKEPSEGELNKGCRSHVNCRQEKIGNELTNPVLSD